MVTGPRYNASLDAKVKAWTNEAYKTHVVPNCAPDCQVHLIKPPSHACANGVA